MGNIHFSIEQFEKLKNNDVDSKTALLLKSFDPNREEKPKSSRRVNDYQKTPNDTDSKLSAPGVKKISDEEWERIKENAERIGNKLTYKETLERVKKKNAMIRKYGVLGSKRKKQTKKRDHLASASSIRKKKKYVEIKRKEIRHISKTTKSLYDERGKDHYDFAGEYEARNIEFGHGRKKSQEWKGVLISGQGGSIGKMQRLRQEDPNVFDRQAMK